MLRAPAEVNGLIDADGGFLRRHGVSDFSKYSVVPGALPRRIMLAQSPRFRCGRARRRGKEGG
jgi:hypothetical protein